MKTAPKKRTAKQLVRIWCAEHDVYQWKLALDLGIDRTYLSMILSGARKPTEKIVEDMKRITGIDLRETEIGA